MQRKIILSAAATMVISWSFGANMCMGAPTWNVVSTNISNGQELALAFRPDGVPALAFSTASPWPFQVSYMVKEGTWTVESPGPTCGYGAVDLAFTADGHPAIAYVTWTGITSLSCTRQGMNGAWSSSKVSTLEGCDPSMALAPTGRLAVVFRNTDDPSGNGWKYDYAEQQLSGDWNVRTAAICRYTASQAVPSLKFQPVSGDPAMSYPYAWDTSTPYELREIEMRYAYRAGGTWYSEVIDTAPKIVGLMSDLEFAYDGSAIVCYYDSTNTQLKFARRLGPDNWVSEVVDNSGDVGSSCSLSVLPDGSPMIGYFDYTHHAFRIATKHGGTWDIQMVAQDLVASDVVMELDPSGNPYVMFKGVDGCIYEAAVPEPASLSLLALGGMAMLRRRRR